MKQINGNIQMQINEDKPNKNKYEQQYKGGLIEILKFILDDNNVRDYLVILLVISFIVFIWKGIDVSEVYYTLLGTAVGYYFRGKWGK